MLTSKRTLLMNLTSSILLVLFLISASTGATSIQSLSFKQLSQNAELVFEGEVSEVQSELKSNKSSIVTLITFDVRDVILGNWSEPTITLEFLGGTVEGQTMRIQALVYPQLGEHGVYFVESTHQQMVNPLLGWAQGHFKVKNDEMATSSGQMISSLNEGQVSPLGTLSKGPANGVQVKGKSSQSGVTLSDFKRAILQARD